MSWDQEGEREFWRHKCVNSFWHFFKEAWGYDRNPRGAISPNPWLLESTHKPACDWFDMHAKEWLDWRRRGINKPKKLICVVPRDWGKTTLFAGAGQGWLHVHDPELSTYTGCETTTRAREVLENIKSVISGVDKYSRYAWLYGTEWHKDRTWKIDRVVTRSRTNLTRRDASYGIWSVESGMVGLHPDGCFFDDPNTYEKMQANAEWLDIVNRHQDTLIPVFQSNALWMLTATRYGVGDHIGRSLRLEGCASMTGMPMPDVEVTPDGQWHVFFMDAIDEQGNLTMPHIWSRERIAGFENRNPQRYWSQIRNNPRRSPHNLLTREVCERFVVPPPDTADYKKMRISIHMDTAFKALSRRARGDRNTISAVGHLTDGTGVCKYLGSRWSVKWDSEEFAKNLIEMVRESRMKGARVACMTDEEEIGGKPGLWRAFLHNKFAEADEHMPDLILINRGHHRKGVRLSEAASLWRDGKMQLVSNAPGLDLLVEEMCSIDSSDFDDFAEPVSDAFNKEVYTTIFANSTTTAVHARNPFDDILKPGQEGTIAANEIADMHMRAERDTPYFDVVVQ